jgi:hypothetical protein
LSRNLLGGGFREDQPPAGPRAYAGTSGAAGASLPTSSAYPSPHSNITNTSGYGGANDTVSRLESVIQQLQQQLAQQVSVIQQLQHGKAEDLPDRTVNGNVASAPVGEFGTSAVRGVMSKSRFLGQSHWMNGIRFVSFSFYSGVPRQLWQSFYVQSTAENWASR